MHAVIGEEARACADTPPAVTRAHFSALPNPGHASSFSPCFHPGFSAPFERADVTYIKALSPFVPLQCVVAGRQGGGKDAG